MSVAFCQLCFYNKDCIGLDWSNLPDMLSMCACVSVETMTTICTTLEPKGQTARQLFTRNSSKAAVLRLCFYCTVSRPDKGPELGNLGDKQYHRSLHANEMLDG